MNFKFKIAALISAITIVLSVGGCATGDHGTSGCASGTNTPQVQLTSVRPEPFHSNDYSDAHPGVIKRSDENLAEVRPVVIKRGDEKLTEGRSDIIKRGEKDVKKPGGARRGLCLTGQKFR